jgi:hypothetical protein
MQDPSAFPGVPAFHRGPTAHAAWKRPNDNHRERIHRERRHSPLKLADAERIASGLGSPVTLAPQTLAGRIAHGVKPKLDLDWPAMMSEEVSFNAAGVQALQASVDPGAMADDILDLPEPIEERYLPLVSRPSSPPAPRGDHFDYTAWSRQLNDLLQQPIKSPSHAHSADSPMGGRGGPSNGATGSSPISASGNVARLAAGTQRRSTWTPIIVLCLSGAMMGGVIGGAAYGLASPEVIAWVTGAGDLLGRLQIAVSR